MSMIEQPIRTRSGTIIPNRVALAPLTNTQSNPDGTLHRDEFNWLTRRAGSFGLVSTCAAYISLEGKAWIGQLGIAEDKHLPGLTKLAEGINNKGSASVVQLHHAGKRAEQAPQKISSDAGDQTARATLEDIERITKDFVTAAKRAEEAGFDGVEIHGANGYIFTQFLSPVENTRGDAYGGNIAGRARFLRETVQQVRDKVDDTFMVNVRISPVNTYADRGLVIDDSIQVADWLAEDGVDIIHLSLRDATGPPPLTDNQIPVVSSMRKTISQEVPVAAAGGVWTRADAQEVLEVGGDIVVLGKAGIAHPDWMEESNKEAFEPIKPPWHRDHLRDVSVSDKFIQYMEGMRGMIKEE